MYRSSWWLLITVLMIDDSTSILTNTTTLSKQFYVVPFPFIIGNNGDGSFARPYSSLQQVLDRIERDYHENMGSIHRTTISLYPTHHFVGSIQLRETHSHIRIETMNMTDTLAYEQLLTHETSHRRLSRAVISGGVPVTGWTQVNETTYSATVPSLNFVNQLFINDQRIVRTRVPTNYSDYLHYAALLNDTTMARYGFQYEPGQFDYKSLVDAMVIVYHSWTESHHYIDRLITSNNTVIFSNPAGIPFGRFNELEARRFHIENLCEALVPNSFCFVNQTKTIYLMTNGSYDPNKSQVITSVNETVVSIASNDMNNPVEDIILDNIAIQHGAWNINRTQPAEDVSAEFLTSVALFMANATSIMISNMEISHTGSFGIRIKEGTSNINVINSLITDMGAGGIWIGDLTTPIPMTPKLHKILSSEISYGGNVFPSGGGINIRYASDIVIADNTIHHLRYNGISVGNSGYRVVAKNIIIQGNYVHNTGQHVLNDQSGIYTVGIQPGTIITNNVVKNIFTYSGLMWGIYLDDGSSEIVVSNNVVYNTGWAAMSQKFGANNTIINNVFARASLWPPPHPGDRMSDGDVHIHLAENHTAWTYTRNIVYDTYQGANHSAYMAWYTDIIAPFYSNVYFNPYGTLLLFGPNVTFAEWQESGQDNGSVIADPLFAGDVNQCDFFTVQANSPAVKLGFVNITKLPQWTPGCETDDKTDRSQFYHW